MKAPRHILLALALCALLALVATGCGGGGGESTETTAASTVETTPALTKAELIEQGDAICGEVNAAVGSIVAGEGEASGAGPQVPSLYVGMIEDIEGLGIPAETEGYAEFSEAAEELAKVEGEAKLAAEREDTVALEEAEGEALNAREEFEAQSEVYGFEKCGEGPTAPGAGANAPGSEEAGGGEEGGVEAEEPEYAEPEYVEPEVEEPAPEATEEPAPETGGTGGGTGGGGGEAGGASGGVGPG